MTADGQEERKFIVKNTKAKMLIGAFRHEQKRDVESKLGVQEACFQT